MVGCSFSSVKQDPLAVDHQLFCPGADFDGVSWDYPASRGQQGLLSIYGRGGEDCVRK